MLGIRKIPREDLFGLFFVRKSYGTNWDSYYGTIDALRPLLESEDFSKIVSGFYTSHINESVRISYFVKIDRVLHHTYSKHQWSIFLYSPFGL